MASDKKLIQPVKALSKTSFSNTLQINIFLKEKQDNLLHFILFQSHNSKTHIKLENQARLIHLLSSQLSNKNI